MMIPETLSKNFEAVGAIHLHSDFSDGSLPIPEIAAIAEKKDLDFLMFSDHNTLEPKRLGLEGWYGRVLVLIGCELNDPDDRNHYLAFRIRDEIPQGLSASEYVRKVREMGGFGVIAHPAEKRQSLEAYPPYPWTDWDVEDFDGIEIWNHMSEWMEGVTRTNFPWRIIHPLRSVRFPVWETLERWDRMNQIRRVVGIGGIDVHAFKVRIGLIPFEIYPYKVQFRSIRTHVLIPRPFEREGPGESLVMAENMLFESLSLGRCFVVNASVGDGRGFRFWAEKKDLFCQMGDRAVLDEPVALCAVTPQAGRIALLRNGKRIQERWGTELRWTAAMPGVYRIEVFRKSRGWIYSNPLVLLDPKGN